MNPYYQDDLVTIYHGDCREILPQLSGISAVITDPPYNLTSIVQRFGKEGSAPAKYGKDGSFQRLSKGFMGKEWDGSGVSFQLDTWRLIREACLPGAMLLSFGGTRTSHRLVCAIEDAGWQIRDTICWVYGSGFPKSLDISKAIDKQRGAKRKIIGNYQGASNIGRKADGKFGYRPSDGTNAGGDFSVNITAPATPEAKLWEGYGTALKPAYEPIIVAMNPIDGTFASNALKHKVAGLNIDECRIGAENIIIRGDGKKWRNNGAKIEYVQAPINITHQGRFPANFIHDGSQEVMELFPDRKGMSGGGNSKNLSKSIFGIGGVSKPEYLRGDFGSAARFFYCAKSSRRERDEGLEGITTSQGNRPNSPDLTGKFPEHDHRERGGNNHPTVKPLSLMTYLCSLVKMPEYNLILDPFCGSGTTLLACRKLGIPSIGIDSNKEYCEIASKRTLG